MSGLIPFGELEAAGDLTTAELVRLPTRTRTQIDLRMVPIAADIIRSDETIRQAAADQVSEVVGELNLVESTLAVAEGGGMIGDNNVPLHDYEWDADGKTLPRILEAQADRIGSARGIDAYGATDADGGLIGENNVPLQDMQWDENGRVVTSVLVDQRHRQDIATRSPLAAVPASRGLIVRERSTYPPVVPMIDWVAFFGDSMFHGFPELAVPPATDSVPVRFAHHTGLTVYNGGIHGQSADEIAIRAGALVLMLSVPSGTIPTSGAVAVETTQRIVWRQDRQVEPVAGTLHGRAGTLHRAAGSAALTFTPTDGADASPATGPAPFVPTLGEAHRSSLTFLIAGRNNINYASPTGISDIDSILAATAAVVEGQDARYHRVGLCGVMNNANQPIGSIDHTKIVQIEKVLKATWPEFWTGTRDFFTSPECYTMQGLPVDTAAVAANRPGTSLMVPGDNVHWSSATSDVIAQHLAAWAAQKGWL